MVSTASAVAIVDGSYTIEIQITPEISPAPGIVVPDVGVDGAWNTSFIFGIEPSVTYSSGMFDEIAPDIGGHSTVSGNGNAGEIGITVTGGSILFTSLQIDTINNTAGGNMAQYANDLSIFSGVTSATETILDLQGRFAMLDNSPELIDIDWTSNTLTTGSSISGQGVGPFSGTPVANIGDVNGDSVDDYTATFVSVGVLSGGTYLDGYPYIEIWNTQILSASPVPVPAAIWLFGSGLIGLIGWARRK